MSLETVVAEFRVLRTLVVGIRGITRQERVADREGVVITRATILRLSPTAIHTHIHIHLPLVLVVLQEQRREVHRGIRSICNRMDQTVVAARLHVLSCHREERLHRLVSPQYNGNWTGHHRRNATRRRRTRDRRSGLCQAQHPETVNGLPHQPRRRHQHQHPKAEVPHLPQPQV